MTNSARKSGIGIKPALLIIDVQKKYLSMIPQRDKELAFFFINHLIALFRKNDFPIIRIYHHDEQNGQGTGTELFEYPEEIKIRDEDEQVIKTYSDSFNKTELADILKTHGSNTLFLCGLSAVGCVLATKTGAQNNDFRAFIVKDAIMSHNSEYTRYAEVMFDAVGFDAVELIIENCRVNFTD
jgi:nicotinamidase-related amidase